jgi:hypothetical protein
MRDYVTLTPPDAAFSRGLIPEAILGMLERPLSAGGELAPDNFVANTVFKKFLAEVIAKHGPDDPDLVAEATRIGTGYVTIVDLRTPTPQGEVPPEDIIGIFNVRNGKTGPEQYVPSPNHRLLTKDGFLRLDRILTQRLYEELAARSTIEKPSPAR